MKNNLKQYFTFATRDRRAILALTCLIVLSLLVPLALPYLVSDNATDFGEFTGQIEQYKEAIRKQEAEKSQKGSKSSANNSGSAITNEIAPFNPNQLTTAQAQQLGLPPKVASNIEKYLQKGGKFKKPEDFAKIYGMTGADYQRLQPYITIAPGPAAIANSNSGKEKTERMEFSNFTDPDMPKPAAKNTGIKIDINTATAEDWDRLPGIGATYANMIVNYRNKLGGFSSTEQVKETRGLPEETYNLIAQQLVNNSPQTIKKININTADAASLSKHPYIEKDVAQSIVNIRKQHGNYASVEGIKKSKLIDEALYRKIAPYLTTD